MSRRTPTRRALTALVAGCLALTLAACGSNLSPEDVAAGEANGSGQDSAADGSAGTSDTGSDVTGAGDTGSGDTGSGDTGSGDTGSGDSGSGDAGGGDTGDGGDKPPAVIPDGKAASCDGLKNGVGITDTTITIGNSSDVSGPVPGLFETATQGTQAFVKYFNDTVPDGICGRKLVLKTYDSRTDAAADQQAYASACDEVFAMVGSQSAFDLGGANTAQSCGLPDLRASAVTVERNACTTCFGVQAVNTKSFENAVPDFVKSEYGDAAQHAGFLYINAGAASQNAQAQVRAMTRRGMNFDVVQGIDISEFNYAPYVQQLKDEGVEVVFWTGAYQQSARLRQAMSQSGYTPKLYLRDPTDYNPDYVSAGGDAVDGTVVFTNFVPFEEASSSPEMTNYLSYLDQVKPGATPQFFGVFAWSAARLFVKLATELGGGLTRESLIAAIKKENDWTSEGLHAPQPVGSKGTGECWRFIQLDGSGWKPVGGTKYSCTGLTSTS